MTLDFRESRIHYRRYYHIVEPYLKTKRAAAYLMLFLSLLALSFFGSFAIRPTLTTITQLKRQIKDSQFVDKKLDEKMDQLVQAKNDYQLVSSIIPKVYQALPKKPEVTMLLKELERLAKESDATISALSFQSISYSKTGEENKLSAIDFSLTLKGEYFPIREFFNGLSKTKRIITLESFKIAPQSEEKILSLYLKGKAYYVP